MACKYPALISAVIPFGLVALADAWRHRAAGPVLAYAMGWAIVMTPWLAKNVVDTGNPVYPLGYRVFGARHWDDARERQWAHAHGPRPVDGPGILELGGRRRRPVRLAVAALRRVRPAGSDPARARGGS